METMEQGDKILAKHLQTIEEEVDELTRRVQRQSAELDPPTVTMQLSDTMVPSKDNCMEQMRCKLDSIVDTLQTLAEQQE